MQRVKMDRKFKQLGIGAEDIRRCIAVKYEKWDF